MIRATRGVTLALALAAVAVAGCSGCASGIDGARQAITSAEQAQIATTHALATYSLDYQQQQIEPLLAQAQSAERAGDVQGGAKLRQSAADAVATFRAKRAKATAAIAAVALATAQARAVVELVAQGTKKPADLNQWLTAVASALASAQVAAAEVMK